jgi:hypothetical protein
MNTILLLLSICFTETKLVNKNNFKDVNGTSYGICQIKLSTARSFYPFVDGLALQQVNVNFSIAKKYIEQLQNKYKKDDIKTISAYNAGHYTKSNKKYVDKVLMNMLILTHTMKKETK